MLLINCFIFINSGNASIWIDFDQWTVSHENQVPQDAPTWHYDSPYKDNLDGANGYSYSGTSMYYDTTGYGVGNNIHNYFHPYQSDAYNTIHMGYMWYGFIDISDEKAISGNALKIVCTGGKNNTGDSGNTETHGAAIHNKYEFINYSGDPVSSDSIAVGAPAIYFKTSDQSTSTFTPFPESYGKNALSVYIHLPPEASVTHDSLDRPARTISIGTFNDLTYANKGNHYYHDYYINGGGWIKCLIQSHPIQNNAGDNTPNDYWNNDPDFFDTLRRLYITSYPYTGVATPKFSIYIDELEFLTITEHQNWETITNPAIGYYEDNTWEISISTKYKCKESGCYDSDIVSFEVKYSFSPITNANYISAEFTQIESTAEFSMPASAIGRFNKQATGYPRAWAKFKLKDADAASIIAGTTVYFAIKDISSTDKYTTYPDSYQGAIDLVAVPGTGKNRNELVNLIDFRIPGEQSQTQFTGTGASIFTGSGTTTIED